MLYVVVYKKRHANIHVDQYTAAVVEARTSQEAIAKELEGDYIEDGAYNGFVAAIGDDFETFETRRTSSVDVESHVAQKALDDEIGRRCFNCGVALGDEDSCSSCGKLQPDAAARLGLTS